MRTVDAALIMSLKPCREWPETRVREAVPEEIPIGDFLRAAHIPPEDRLWVALRKDFCTDTILRLFACDCAERALLRERDAGREPDERSWAAVDVARQYARGDATEDELSAARHAAWDAVRDAWCAARDAAAGAAALKAAGEAAWFAGEAARDAAAGTAVKDASSAAASAAASDAASAAAWNAVKDAARDAVRDAAWNVSWSDEASWQCKHLAKMLEEQI